jgi:hypothetical protein
MGDRLANKPLTNDQEVTPQGENWAFDLLLSVGVAGFEPTTSSSRTRVEREDQYQRVLLRARGCCVGCSGGIP